MKHLATLNFENSENTEGFRRRIAARAVILDKEGNMALMHVANHGYYKLPGGGVDEGEDIESALHRECKEEAGCAIEIVGEIGTVSEVRGDHAFMQDSHAYIARLIGEKGEPELTDLEIEGGFEICWIPIEEALLLLRREGTTGYEAEYIVERDAVIVEEAQNLKSPKEVISFI